MKCYLPLPHCLPIFITAFVLGEGALLATNSDSFPYPDGLVNDQGAMQVWTLGKIRNHRDRTINPGGETVKDKDIRSRSDLLGYPSPHVETRTFSTELDLSDSVIPATIAILVDDEATLTITDLSTNEDSEPIEPRELHVNGSALWKSRSYKEFPGALPGGKRYKLDLEYTNRANLTSQYNGQRDVDGVTIYVSLLPIEVIQPVLGKQRKHQNDNWELPPDGLRPCRWTNAFTKKSGERYRLDPSFIKQDPDRVIVRIPIPDADSLRTYDIWIKSLTPNGDTKDLSTQIELKPSDKAPGYYETPPFILVTDEPDDRISFNGLANGQLSDNEKNDLTHHVELGGEVEFLLPNELGTTNIKVPVMPPSNFLKVNITILVPKDTPAWRSYGLKVLRDIKASKEIFAAHGIKFTANWGIKIIDDDLAWIFEDNVVKKPTGTDPHPTEMTSLVQHYGSPRGGECPAVIYVPALITNRLYGPRGLAWNKPSTGNNKTEYLYGNCFISLVNNHYTPNVLPHEVAHLLGAKHVDIQGITRPRLLHELMADGPEWSGAYTDSKRIGVPTEEVIRKSAWLK